MRRVLFVTAASAALLLSSFVAPANAATTATPPGAPRGLTTADVTETTVDLSWLPGLAGSDPIAAFDVYASAYGLPYRVVASSTITYAYVVVGGLRPGTTYQIVVRARDTTGVSGPPSPPVTVRTGARGTSPGPPVAIATTSTTATVVWTPVLVHGDQVFEYDIIVPARTPTAPILRLGYVTAPATTVTLTGLSPGRTYSAIVWARYANGAGGTVSVRGTFSTTAS